MDKCDYCGRQVQPVVITGVSAACIECASKFDTCFMCMHCSRCEFVNNPSPIPHMIMQTVRQGPMTMQTQIKNPERVKEFCFPCKCFDQENLVCRREQNWCRDYSEYVPELPYEDLSEIKSP